MVVMRTLMCLLVLVNAIVMQFSLFSVSMQLSNFRYYASKDAYMATDEEVYIEFLQWKSFFLVHLYTD